VTTPPHSSYDVLIVGSGIMGASVAHLLRQERPEAQVLMIDGGSTIGATPGLHLHDSDDPATVERYGTRVSSGIQSMYVGADLSGAAPASLDDAAPGMYSLTNLGEESAAMPAAAAAWNVGGMGVHWTAATPWPAGSECFDFGDPDQWARDLASASEVLNVTSAPIGLTSAGAEVLRVFEGLFGDVGPADRRPQLMPMAVHPAPDAYLRRTGPSLIHPPIGQGDDPAFTLLTGTMATAVLHDGQRVTGARVLDIASGESSEVDARIVVVCADAMRTPQLLYASGIRPAALGRYLNEHAFVTGRVLMDLDRFGLTREKLPRPRPGEFATDALWIPQNGQDQPFHGQITDTVFVDDHDNALAYSVGISLYTPVQSTPANRLVFSDTETDLSGMPRIRVEFAYSDDDLVMINRALDQVAEIASHLGPFDPETERALLPPGSSLHQTGTVRMGAVNDGSSVCDPSGRVWGYDNLYLAGNGVIPTAVVCNATLTGVVTAVRAARAIATQLSGAFHGDPADELATTSVSRS